MATERVRAAEGMGISTDRDFKDFPLAAVFPLCFPKESVPIPKILRRFTKDLLRIY